MVRILADENVHSDIVRRLRNEGHDLLYVPEIVLAEAGYRIHRYGN